MNRRPINLLPEEASVLYHKSRRATVITRIIVGIAILLILVIVFIATAGMYLKILTDANENRLTVIEGSQELKRASEVEDLISGFSQELVILRDLKVKQYDPSFLVREIISTLPDSARLQRFELSFVDESSTAAAAKKNNSGDAPKIVLQGIADTRADVLEFQHAMEAFDFVARVEAPTENIIDPTNIHFQFELTLIPAADAEKVKIDASENINVGENMTEQINEEES